MEINILETNKDGNCLINAILKSFGIDTKYEIDLRKLIGNIIKGTNIDENILQALNYRTKEEYISGRLFENSFLRELRNLKIV